MLDNFRADPSLSILGAGVQVVFGVYHPGQRAGILGDDDVALHERSVGDTHGLPRRAIRPDRNRGLGVRFFAEREAHARRLGRFDCCAFCAVQRPAEHPRRPADYQPLDAFWQRRGFRHHPELRTEYHWQDLDKDAESAKPMSFWLKELTP